MRLFIFDVGGVMVDGFDIVPALAADLGLDPEALLTEFEAAGVSDFHDGVITPHEFWRRFEARTGLSVRGEPWRDYFKPSRRPAMYALVERLQAAGARVVAGTNTIDPHYEVHAERGDYAVFDHVYASNLMGVSKPHPAFWLSILEAEGVAPAEAFFVDDLPLNVAAAASVGLLSVQYVTEEQVALAADGALALAPWPRSWSTGRGGG